MLMLKKIKRRAFLRISGLTSLAYLLRPFPKALAFSAFKMRRRRLSPGPLLVTQAMLATLVLNDAKNLKSSQVVQVVLGKDSSQNLKSTQTVLVVLVPT